MSRKLTEQELDTVLREALCVKEEPGEALNRKILNGAKETMSMNKKARKMAAAVAAGLLLFTGVSVSVYAGVKYLTPQQVAKESNFGDKNAIEAAFEGENAVYVNETKNFDGGTATFLGIAQGAGVNVLTGMPGADDNRSYAVFAFEGLGDGLADNELSNIVVSPFIKGLEPWRYNAWTIGSGDDYGANGFSEIVRDGVRYQIVECGNLEMFADRGVYMGISYEMAGGAFEMSAETGEIRAKAEYADKAVLFTIPFDAARADRAAADAVIEDIRKFFDEPSQDGEAGDGAEESPFGEWNAERIQAEGKLLENLVFTVKPDDKGMISTPQWETKDGAGSGGGHFPLDFYFPDNQPGMSDMMLLIGADEPTALAETYTLNADGTVTIAVYEIQMAR
ncbi:MAG: hypothetical protein NC086_00550 [Alistipes sp.]|nr:hypothetical protein [Alistipes sp.]